MVTRSAKPFLDALAGIVQPGPPFWLMRQAGRYLPEYRAVRAKAGNFLNLCLSPEQACEVTLQPLRRYGMDAAILFSDILMVPYGLGQPLDYVEGEGPQLAPVADRSAIEALSRERFQERLAPVYDTVTRVRQALPEGAALIGFAGAPWTVACYMVQGGGSKEWERVKGLAYRDPAGFGALIDLLVEVTIDYLSAQINAGAEAVQLFDSWAGILPAPMVRRLVIEPTRRIAEALKQAHPEVPIIGFPRGVGVMVEEYARTAGVDAVALDTTIPPEWAARQVQTQRPVQGNLDPIALMAGGPGMAGALDAVLEALADGPYVFNLGHGVPQHTPPAHVAELSRLLRSWPERRA